MGDTIVVRTLRGGRWPRPMVLIEERRIGRLDGPEELMFGSVLSGAADSHGGVYVFDGQVPALRYYDAAGRYVRTLGRKGAGPGEYQDALLSLALRRDGRLIVRDPRNARLTLYHPDGTPSDHWPVASGLFTSQAMTLDTADHVYLRILVGQIEPGRPWPIGLLHLDDHGRVVDTIPPPSLGRVPGSQNGYFQPSTVWAMSPFGSLVVGVTDQYAFEVRPPGGPVTRVERTWEPVRLRAEERAEWEAIRAWQQRTQGRFMTSPLVPTPASKPAYRDFTFDTEGRIWVRRFSDAVQTDTVTPPPQPLAGSDRPPLTWHEPLLYDVFLEDGTYLGEVHAPWRTTLWTIGPDWAWGMRTGELDEPYIVRFRLAPEAPN